MAMPVAGFVPLGTLMDVLRNELGCKTRKAKHLVYSGEGEVWYQPEWLVKGDKHVALPSPCDPDELVGPGFVRLVEDRLGVEVPEHILFSFESAGPYDGSSDDSASD